MRRALLIAAASLALAAPAGAQTTTLLKASLSSCATAAHSAIFAGSMPAVRGTRTMAMRFDLQRLGEDGSWGTVAVPGLGLYKRSSAGQSGFVFTQRVQALSAPGSYRALVRFRWYAHSGRLLKHATRATPACLQPDPRADLRPGGLSRTATGYALVVLNSGRSDAGPFAVDVAGVRAQVAGLQHGAQVTVEVAAPPCSGGQTVPVVVDALDQVDEAAEADDSVQKACPLS